MVSKERIDRPKLCFRVIRPRIIFIIEGSFFSLSFRSFLFLFHHFFFDSPFFLVHFLTILFCSCSFLFSNGMSSTSLELHFFTFAFQHQAFDRLSSRKDFSLPLPPMWRVVLDQDIEGNLSGSKGVTMDNFFLSVRGWWKMAISHLKHSYLNWRVIPCRRKMIFLTFLILI